MKALVLDFDGVIADSIDEHLLNSFSAYRIFNKKTRLFGGSIGFEDFSVKKNRYKNQYFKFRKYRAFVRKSMDLYCVLLAIEENHEIKSYKDIDKILAKISLDEKEYLKEHFRIRIENIDRRFSKWLRLIPPFQQMIKFLESIDKRILFISTTNRKKVIFEALKNLRYFFH